MLAMMRWPWLVIVVLLLLAAPASAELYRWTDGDGIAHYTNSPDSVPAAYRTTVVELVAPSPRPGEAATPDASTAIVFASGAPIIALAHLNGVPLRLLVDTGASRTLISPAALTRAGYPPGGGRVIRIAGVTGTALAREVTVPALEVSNARVGPITVLAYAVGPGEGPAASAASVPADAVDGLLGRDVLQFFTLAVDTAAGQAVLKPR